MDLVYRITYNVHECIVRAHIEWPHSSHTYIISVYFHSVAIHATMLAYIYTFLRGAHITNPLVFYCVYAPLHCIVCILVHNIYLTNIIILQPNRESIELVCVRAFDACMCAPNAHGKV